MATQVQLRRGTTAQHSSFTGAAGELTVDTDKRTAVVHDGSTAGGAPLLRENGAQNAVTTGTSTAASFIPTSSTVPTNGVYLPAANSVGISTNETGRLFIDSSGNVKITSSQYQALAHKTYGYGSTYGAVTIGASNDNYGNVALGVDVSSIAGGSFSGNNQVIFPTKGALIPNSAGNDFLGLFARNSSNYLLIGPALGGGITNGPLTVTSTSLGIGTSSPSTALHAFSTGTEWIGQFGNITANGSNVRIRYNAIAAFGANSAASNLLINPDGGNVGIGTASPSKELQISATTPTIRLEENSASAKRLDISVNSSGEASVFATQSSTQLLFGTVGTERTRIDSIGYLTGLVNGLGTGLYQAQQLYRLNAGLAGSNVTTAQSVLGVGVTLTGSTVYEFQGVFTFTKTSGTTSHSFGIGFGGTATLNNIYTQSIASSSGSALPTNSTGFFGASTAASIFNLLTGIGVATVTVSIHVRGTISVGTGGTFIPQYTLSSAPGGAYTTTAGSYFKIAPLGASGSATSIGTWS